ncbi:MAG TPA: flagellar basal-body MS-ring/collar protein FliF [Rhodocyclaceae bacterium]|nr:flagellar basal-body MS-ring/collar protein FliF [Rhodocyclaceae bacterium]
MFENIKTMWADLSGPKRLAFGAGLALLLICIIGLTVWLTRDTYDVLFSGLDTQDQATIVGELEKLKIPYRISDDGASILVPKDAVNTTRLKVMSQGVDLKGTVGFEIFNQADFGASEFAQKINYQRALQGELARTITSFDEIKGARVHLVLPEGGLLRRTAATEPKASVALTMKGGQQLSTEQVSGIQRLVAAAVPGLEPQAVVVSDQEGVTLSKPAQDGSEGDSVSGKLEMKRQAEQYLTRKLVDLLDKAIGPGQAIVSVDVTLNHDQITSNREDLLGTQGRDGETIGALVKKRETTSANANTDTGAKDDASLKLTTHLNNGPQSVELEYAYGKKVEQIVSSPGSIKRLSVGVFLPPNMDDVKIQKIRDIVSMAVGLNPQRGDGIAIQSISSAAPAPANKGGLTFVPQADDKAAQKNVVVQDPDSVIVRSLIYALIVVVAIIVLAWALLSRRRLSAHQRERLLMELKTWLEKDNHAAQGAAKS